MASDPSLKACVDWLVRCSLLPRDHWLASGNAQLSDLAHQLKDGVLLCHLLNRLYPSAVDPKDFSQRPQMSEFLSVKNSRAFLQACKSVFRMKDEDLFEVHILFTPNGCRKVLQTLSALSKTPLALRSGVAPFNVADNYYTNMTSFDTSFDESSSEYYDDDEVEYYYSSKTDDNEDKIYGCLVELTVKDTQPKTKRDMCIQELVETEKKYVEVLNSIQRHFMKPLRECRQLLSQSDFDKIFMGIEKLSAVHTDFKASLLRACENNSTISIPDCFVTCKEKFLFYGEYCANLTLAQETIEKQCQINPVLLSKVVELEEKANGRRFRMCDMLSVPMQRVLKYHLLLKELIKNTKEDDPERKMLEKALDETQDLSLFVNEVKRDRETLSSISLLSASIGGLPKSTHLEDCGRLLKDGEMKVKMSTESGLQPRHIFLFDRVMIMCKTLKGETYTYKNVLVLKYYDVGSTIIKEKGHSGVILNERSGKDSYLILSKKEEQVKKWLEVIKLAQDNENPEFAHNCKHDFEMYTFDKPTICDVCRKLLRGVFFQGYKCTRTDMNVHKECLKAAENMDGPPTGTLLPPKRMSTKMPRVGSVSSRVIKTVTRYNGFPAPGYGRAALSFEVGETIEILSETDPDWPEGELNGRRGFFPRTAVWDPNYRMTSVSSPETPPTPTRMMLKSASQDYQNNSALEEIELASFPWFAGTLSRDIAIQKLNPLPNGSYLIRISDRAGSRGDYAISIKFDEKVMHMKVSRDDDGRYFLGASVKFPNLQALVEYYQQVSLERVYPELKSVLAIPFKNARRPGRHVVGYCVALYDYSATQPSQLSLQKEEIVTILSKADESSGWWRGESRNGRVGIFPVTYVKEINEP